MMVDIIGSIKFVFFFTTLWLFSTWLYNNIVIWKMEKRNPFLLKEDPVKLGNVFTPAISTINQPEEKSSKKTTSDKRGKKRSKKGYSRN